MESMKNILFLFLRQMRWEILLIKGSFLVIFITVVFVLLKKFVNIIIWYKNYRKLFNSLPGPDNTHWFYGNLHMLPRKYSERQKLGKELTKKFPRFYRFWIGPFTASIVLNHPETVKQILKFSDPKPKGFGGAYRHGFPWLGDGLLMAHGKKWARSRRLITPAFHFNILKPYMEIYNKAADQLMQKLRKYAESGESFNLLSVIGLCTLDIILQCAFSNETNCQWRESSYTKAVCRLQEIWAERNRSPWLFPDFIFYMTEMGRQFRSNCQEVHEVAENIISERRKEVANMGEVTRPYLDFMDLLLQARDENGVGMTNADIRNEVDTFLFEAIFGEHPSVPLISCRKEPVERQILLGLSFMGHDTTASAISWVLYSLAVHKDHQVKVQHEVDKIWDGKTSDLVEWDDLHKFEYLSMCLKESLRLLPTVPMVQRQVTHEVTLYDNVLPPNTLFTIAIGSLHQHPEIWENPEDFIPQRFSKENSHNIDNFSFLPFSAGPRNCIGQHFALNEEKVLVSRILKEFTIDVDPSVPVEAKLTAVLKAENGIHVFVKHRTQVQN